MNFALTLAHSSVSSTFAKKMIKKYTFFSVALMLIACLTFFLGVRIGKQKREKEFLAQAVLVSESLGQNVTEEEFLRLMVRMVYLVDELDVQGLLNASDTKEASLMLRIYSLLQEGKIETAKDLSGTLMNGYLLRSDEEADTALQQKIRDLLKQRPMNPTSEPEAS